LPGYGGIDKLTQTTERIFEQLDPQLGSYFRKMRTANLLDLGNRKGKAPGGYCISFPVSQQPFIFMNAVGLPGDVRTLLHEAGHAFHNYERFALPYFQQRIPGLEFAEVASMAMELLTYPYLEEDKGGFYSPAEADQYRKRHLEHILLFWPYMAVVDAFQHWVYQNHEMASDPSSCDAKWLELWSRFLPGIDWSGLQSIAETGWQRKQHIFRYPLYYIEYGLAQLGAIQVWRCALQAPAQALANYRHALSLGGSRPLPALYQAAGAQLAFDAETLADAVTLVEREYQEIE
jgi:oligoendopeptidase F